MLINKWISLGFLFIIFGCSPPIPTIPLADHKRIVGELKKEHDVEIANKDKEHDVEIAKEIANKDLEITAKESEVTQLTTDLGNKESEVAQLTTDLGNKESEVTQLTTDLRQLDTKLQEAQQALDSLDSSIAIAKGKKAIDQATKVNTVQSLTRAAIRLNYAKIELRNAEAAFKSKNYKSALNSAVDAETSANKAFELSVYYHLGRYNYELGRAYKEEEDRSKKAFEEAIKLFEKAIDIDDRLFAEAYYSLALVYKTRDVSGDLDRACKNAKAAIELKPNHKEAKEIRDSIAGCR